MSQTVGKTAKNTKQTANGVDHEPTLQDVLQAVNVGFTELTGEVSEIKGDIHQIKQDMVTHDQLKQKMTELKNELKTELVTKDYLDQKMAEQRSDLILITRKEDRKVVALVHELRDQKVLSEPAAQRILALEPFPQ